MTVSSTVIHPTAIVDPGAQLGAGVSVGPYSIIDAHAEIGEGTVSAPIASLQDTRDREKKPYFHRRYCWQRAPRREISR